jgi:addiction module HigA family antidote
MPRIKRHLYLASRAQPLTKKRRRAPGIQADPPGSAPGPCAGRVVQAQQVALRPGSQMTKPPASSRAGFASLRSSSRERGAGQRSHGHGSRFAPIPAARIILPLNAGIDRFRPRSRRTAPDRSAAAGGKDANRARASEIGEGLSANALAEGLHVPPNRITAILNGTRSITADTALRLARYFRTSPQSWLNLQKNDEREVAKRTVAEPSRPRLSPMQPSGEESADGSSLGDIELPMLWPVPGATGESVQGPHRGA